MEIRQARVDDKGPLTDIMYSTGREQYDFAFRQGDRTAQAYIRFEFLAGGGFCGYRNLTVAVEENRVVSTACFYDRQTYDRLSCGMVWNVLRFYGLINALRVLKNLIHVASIVTKPDAGELYLSNLGVCHGERGRGIGRAMIDTKRKEARAKGYGKLALDVADTNPRAEKLYRRIGFEVVGEKVFSGAANGFPKFKKMELLL